MSAAAQSRVATPASAAEVDSEATVADLRHFVRIARQGGHPAASGAERVARRLAVALHAVRENLCLLDGSAVAGLCELLRYVAGPWPTDACKEAAFAAVARAAGKRA